MEKRDQIEQIKAMLNDYLRQKGIRTTKPFCCLNPMHEDKHPSMSFYPQKNTVHCFSCGSTYDIFELIGLDYSLTSFTAQYRKATELVGIGCAGKQVVQPQSRASYPTATPTGKTSKRLPLQLTPNPQKYTLERGGEQAEYRRTINADRALPDRTDELHVLMRGATGRYDYFTARGLSEEICRRYGLFEDKERAYLPIFEDGRCTGWCGRAILENTQPRYKNATGAIGCWGSEQTAPTGKTDKGDVESSRYEAIFCGVKGESYFPLQGVGQCPTNKVARNGYDLSATSCFVTEGIINALTLVQLGFRAVALCGSQNAGKLLRYCAQNPTEVNGCTFILCGDDDSAGHAMNATLRDGLGKQGLHCRELRLTGGDINDVYLKQPERLISAVAVALEEDGAPQTSAGGSVDAFFEAREKGALAMATGFDALDDIIDGGLYNGLYVIGAISSAGKTSFVLQLADYIAAHSTDVLFFSLEQSKFELIAKSLSRTSAQLDSRAHKNAFTARQLLVGNADRKARQARYRMPYMVDAQSFGEDARQALVGNADRKARQEQHRMPYTVDAQIFGEDARQVLLEETRRVYARDATGLFIYEGIADIGVAEIRDTVRAHIARRGMRPVVVLDYLQILKPVDARATDKQNTDRAVVELKRISRDFDIPVVAVSSFNRDNYRNAVSMEAFKESGAVEYSSDVLFGIQFAGVGEAGFDVNASKGKEPRAVELVMLKNRNGIPYAKIKFDYYAKFNLFEEAAQHNSAH